MCSAILRAQTDELDALAGAEVGRRPRGFQRSSENWDRQIVDQDSSVRPAAAHFWPKSMPSLWAICRTAGAAWMVPAAAVIGPFLVETGAAGAAAVFVAAYWGNRWRCLPSFSLVGQDRLPDRQLVARLHLERVIFPANGAGTSMVACR